MENNTDEIVISQSTLHTITPLSKYLAMTLFVALPFFGGWIGYTYAPEKIVEIEKVVEVEKVLITKESSITNESEISDSTQDTSQNNYVAYNNSELGIELTHPSHWTVYTQKVPPKNWAWRENLLAATFEPSADPTQVLIYRHPSSLEETLRETEEISPDYNPQKWDAERTIVKEIRLDERTVTQRIQFQGINTCSKIEYFHTISPTATGVVEISGICPTHPDGYDAEKIKAAESVKFDS